MSPTVQEAVFTRVFAWLLLMKWMTFFSVLCVWMFCHETILPSGLAGKDSWQQALTDQYIELVEDLFKDIVKTHFEKDEIKKVKNKKLTMTPFTFFKDNKRKT